MRPGHTLVEVDSDEELRAREPRLSGALRGLNPNNMLQKTPKSIEAVKNTETPDSRHVTRASRNGRVPVNYSAKYHPMDDVLRPKRAALITDSRSLSTSASRGNGDDNETSDESEPELLSDDESENESGESEADVPATRKPDPRATRHSTRSETQKLVNYSRAHHPQDHALPGFQHLAKRGRRRSSATYGKKTTPDEEIVVSSDEEINDNCEDNETQVKASSKSSPPRKRLKTLGRVAVARIPPSLPRDESSNPVDAIIQGRHFAPPEGHDTNHSHNAAVNAEATCVSDSDEISKIGAFMANVLENMGILAENHIEPVTSMINGRREDIEEEERENVPPDSEPGEPDVQHQAVDGKPGQHHRESSEGEESESLPDSEPCELKPPHQIVDGVEEHEQENHNSTEVESSTSEASTNKEHQREVDANDQDRLKQALRASSQEAARYANAREATRSLFNVASNGPQHAFEATAPSRQGGCSEAPNDEPDNSNCSFFDGAFPESLPRSRSKQSESSVTLA